MTTRRDIMTGFAALPIAVAPAFASSSAVEAKSIDPPPAPEFFHAIDHSIFQDLEAMERLIGQAKAKLLAANTADQATRYCSLFDMRCTTNALTLTTDLMRSTIEEQRLAADTANQTERLRRRKQTEPTALTS